MAEIEFPSNSEASKVNDASALSEEQIPLPDISAPAKEKKISPGGKFFRMFIRSDMDAFKQSVMTSIFVPIVLEGAHRILNGIVDLYFNGLMTGGTITKTEVTSVGSEWNPQHIAYDKPSLLTTQTTQSKKSFNYYHEVTAASKEDAEKVIAYLQRLLNTPRGPKKARFVRLSEFYAAAQVTGYETTDNYWGWTNLDNATFQYKWDGRWLYVLPDVIDISNLTN